MRSIRFVFLIAISAVLPCQRLAAQSVQVAPSLAVAEEQYRDAEEAWLRADPNLEADLFNRPPDEIRKRIRRAAGLREDVMIKKTAFLDFMVKRMAELQSRVGSASSLSNPTQDFRKDLDEEQARLREEQQRVEERLQQIPRSEDYSQVRSTIEAEQADLFTIRQTVERRIQALNELSKAQETAKGLAQEDDIPAKVTELRTIWEGELERSQRSRKAWANYYDSLEKSATKNATTKRTRSK